MRATTGTMPNDARAKRRRQTDDDAVYKATAELVLRQGVRKLRTLQIAKQAKITETTLFRRFGKLPELLTATYDWAWGLVDQAIINVAFADPLSDAKQALLRDTSSIWDMRADPDLATAATFALLFFRRKNEVDIISSRSELLFTDRLQSHCGHIMTELGSDDESSGALLATLILNYLATIWLTWWTMPRGRDDPNGIRDLSQDDAQLGVLLLLERFWEHQAS